MKATKGYIFSLLTILFLSVFIAACTSNNESGSEVESNSATEEQSNASSTESSTKVMEDAMSDSVEIPANPERIIAPYLEDSLIALGIKPAAQWSIGETVLDYLQPSLQDVPTIGWDLPVEQVLSHEPDLIILSSAGAIQNGLYEEYMKIAPTYVFKDEVSADWREQLRTMGEIVNKEEEAEAALTSYEEKAAAAKEQLQESIGDESVAILWVMAQQYYLFEETRLSANVLYDDLGLTVPSFVEGLPEAKAQWDPISLEKLADLDADHLFVLYAENETASVEELYNSSIWKGLPAVTNNQVYEIKDPSNWTISGLVASEKTIDEVMQALAHE
ncbi:iron-hydroxamate ABC transporter substrate-binding protein [Halalkalibacterium ligniniphilum]|uniref:iron-hydroxamate ABC transporter substrate-binding protein n=1 Tax=Halalkalibacterium ligniniphilum TaxID=1134413 RepID=UPI0003455C3C|nr:iron-hydroxamate ABC transporter substrate-binding protein [Halalkalibacterium ligniniphilum]